MVAGVLDELRRGSLGLDFQSRLPQFPRSRLRQALDQLWKLRSLGSSQRLESLGPESDGVSWGANAVDKEGRGRGELLFEDQPRQLQPQGRTGLEPKWFNCFREELAAPI